MSGLDGLFNETALGKDTPIGGANESLSGGQTRRVALARLVARDPQVVVLDEAFAGLDPASRRVLRGNILRWAKEAGRTVIEFSHELNEAGDADAHARVVAGRLEVRS